MQFPVFFAGGLVEKGSAVAELEGMLLGFL
jgi:hypothetical protein